LPNCRLSIEQAIPEHAGLGSGTQLGLGVAALLSAFVGLASPAPQDLAQSVGRGLRSAVGTYGFAFGGLIVEQGKSPQDAISPLEYRLDLPAEWRFVLMTPCGLAGLAGQEEAQAFECLPPVPSPVTTTLVSEVQERLAPAAAAADFDAFAESVYRYGRLAGECFAARQGGPYNGPLVTELVESVRRVGCAGVGQSSWGPTVFAVTSSRSAADQLVQRLQTAWREPLSIVVTGAANHGARLVEHAHDREPAVP
jgi:beta-RFAP synthase